MRSQSIATTKVLSFLCGGPSLQWCKEPAVVGAWLKSSMLQLELHLSSGMAWAVLLAHLALLVLTSHGLMDFLAGPCTYSGSQEDSCLALATVKDHACLAHQDPCAAPHWGPLSPAALVEQSCLLLSDTSLLSWPLKLGTSSSLYYWVDYNIWNVVTAVTPARCIPVVVQKQDNS